MDGVADSVSLCAAPARRPRKAGRPGRRGRPSRPARRRAPPAAAPEAAALQRTLKGLVLLVIEDEPDSREVLRQMIEALGARPLLAADGHQALDVLLRERPHAILCDLLMPGMDGLSFARHLHARPDWTGIPIIAVTALGGVADYIRTWSHGFQAHLTKPVTIDDLAVAVRRFTARSTRPSAGPAY
jgi:two-component system CheB/CheR fusion protein